MLQTGRFYDVVVINLPTMAEDYFGTDVTAVATILHQARTVSPATFLIVCGQLLHNSRTRLELFKSGANMLGNNVAAIYGACTRVLQQHVWPVVPNAGVQSSTMNITERPAAVPSLQNCLTCFVCKLKGLCENAFRFHFLLYHTSHAYAELASCPLCHQHPGRSFNVHLHNRHGELSEHEAPHPAFAAFAWIVCRNPRTLVFLHLTLLNCSHPFLQYALVPFTNVPLTRYTIKKFLMVHEPAGTAHLVPHSLKHRLSSKHPS